MHNDKQALYIGLAMLVAAACMPLLASGYYLHQVTVILCTAIALLGLSLLTGFNGQVSLGHGAFVALGAYTFSILSMHAQWPAWLLLPVAAGVSFVVGVAFGFPALRLKGSYLAMATLALAMAVPQILKHPGVEKWTGGVQGLALDRGPAPFGINDDSWYFWLCLLLFVLAYRLCSNLTRYRVGRAIMAVRDHPVAAASMGVDVARYKVLTFGVSAMLAGLSGALGALVAQFTAPDSFTLGLSILLYVGIVVGGVASLPGALIGACFLQFIPQLADSMSKGAPGAIFGSLMILSIFALPRGIAGLLSFRRRVHPAPPPVPPMAAGSPLP